MSDIKLETLQSFSSADRQDGRRHGVTKVITTTLVEVGDFAKLSGHRS